MKINIPLLYLFYNWKKSYELSLLALKKENEGM